MKPRARQESGVWLVWCDKIGPSPREKFVDAYLSWALRRAAVHVQRVGFLIVEVG